MELNEDTVLAAVNDLRARTGKRVTSPPGMHAPTDEQGNAHPEFAPPFPARVRTLNTILLRLGEGGKLPVEQSAMVVFPPL